MQLSLIAWQIKFSCIKTFENEVELMINYKLHKLGIANGEETRAFS